MIEQHGDKGEVVIEEVKETEPSAQVSSEDMINEVKLLGPVPFRADQESS